VTSFDYISTCLSWSFVLTRCCALTWVTKIRMRDISNVNAGRRFSIAVFLLIYLGDEWWEFTKYTWNGHFLEIGTKNKKFLEKPEIGSLTDLILAMAVLFADMTLTPHKSQVHCSGVMQWWACSSLNPLHCWQRQVAKFGSGCSNIGLYCVTITWQQRFTFEESYGGRCFAACDCWMQTSGAVQQEMQRDNNCW